jgi:hypothetical protein
MDYSFLSESKTELLQAVEYYEQCSTGLGLEFSEEVYSSIKQILRFPLAWSSSSKNTRRCLTKRFPYGIIYAINEDSIIIIAIMHLNRKPNYWHKRIKKHPWQRHITQG